MGYWPFPCAGAGCLLEEVSKADAPEYVADHLSPEDPVPGRGGAALYALVREMDAFTIRAGRQAADAVCLEPPGADEARVAGVDEGEPTSIGVGCHQQGVFTAEDEQAGGEGQLYRCREAQGCAAISALLEVDEGYLPTPGGGDGAALASAVQGDVARRSSDRKGGGLHEPPGGEGQREETSGGGVGYEDSVSRALEGLEPAANLLFGADPRRVKLDERNRAAVTIGAQQPSAAEAQGHRPAQGLPLPERLLGFCRAGKGKEGRCQQQGGLAEKSG